MRRGKYDPRRGVLAALLVVLLLLVTAGWLSGGLATVPLSRARQSLARYDLEEAAQWMVLAQRLRGSTAELEWLEARLARKFGNLPRMEEHLEKAASQGVSRQRLIRERMLAAAQSGQLAEVEDDIHTWMLNPDNEEPEIYDAYANGLTMLGRLQDAQVLLENWQRDFPQDAEPLYRRARIAEHLTAQDEAEQLYREALARDPDHPTTLYAMGRLLLDRKRPEEALPYFRDCARHCPSAAPAANVGEAGCLILLGQSEQARLLLEQAVGLEKSQRREAYHRIRDVSEVDPAILELGKLESADRNYEAAEKLLRQSVQENSRDPEIRYAYAVALRGAGRPEEAQREFEYVTEARDALAKSDVLFDGLQNQPDNAEARYQIGIIYLKYRSERAGIYWLQSALSHDPDHVPTHRALAEYYQQQTEKSPGSAELARYHREMAKRGPVEAGKQNE